MGFSDGKAFEFEKELTENIGGRPVGSAALLRAEHWAKGKFEQMGLTVTMQEVGRLPVEFVRGPAEGSATIGDESIDLHFVTPAFTAGTNGPVDGKVFVEPLTSADMKALQGRLQGAWILVGGQSQGTVVYREKEDSVRSVIKAHNDSVALAHTGEPRASYAEKLRIMPALFYKELVAEGVKGFIQPGELPLLCLADRAHCYTLTEETLPKVCDVKLEAAQYRRLRQAVSAGTSVRVKFNIGNSFVCREIPYSNVIARLEGTEFPDEYVIIGGHLDAYDAASGAVDDGTGTCTVLEAARLITSYGARPRRTILFCLWTGEEYGLLGSKYFCKNPIIDLDKVSNYINRDGGSTAVINLGALIVNRKGLREACSALMASGTPVEGEEDSVVLPDGLPFRITLRQPFDNGDSGVWPGVEDIKQRKGGSDHLSFANEGIPTYSLAEGDPRGYNTDTRQWWHTETDDISKIHPDYLQHNATVSASFLWGLANLGHLLAR